MIRGSNLDRPATVVRVSYSDGEEAYRVFTDRDRALRFIVDEFIERWLGGEGDESPDSLSWDPDAATELSELMDRVRGHIAAGDLERAVRKYRDRQDSRAYGMSVYLEPGVLDASTRGRGRPVMP